MPQKFTPKETGLETIVAFAEDATAHLAIFMAVQGRRGRSPNAAPEGKPGDGNIRARFRSFCGAAYLDNSVHLPASREIKRPRIATAGPFP
ncbi:MAG: hypothetical protein AAAB35_25585 [Phyllobacterium sp.]|uniref:hypothetical protein n=1 Tax=Phyllobacterium sp. TaxID=1871046 RepID=UPI0030F2DC6E